MNREDIKFEEYYTPSELMANNIFPWWNSTMTFMEKMKSEVGMDLFRPIITVGKKNRRYKIKGENVLKVLELADKGELKI